MAGKIPRDSRIITSDDVFDFMLNLRSLNAGIDSKREELFENYHENRQSELQLQSLDDYEQLVRMNSNEKHYGFVMIYTIVRED